MNTLKDKTYTGERALFFSRNLEIRNCIFEDGESPLKESRDLKLFDNEFRWKYPLWYCQNVEVHSGKLLYTARSGVWYTNHIKFFDTVIEAPKTFRRCEDVTLINVKIPHAQETFWKCKNVKLNNVKVDEGDYFCFNCEGVKIDGLELNGNYGFDGAKNIEIRNSKLHTKDAFWNVENVLVVNSIIVGEYLAWNSKNITFINCKIISHQGLCYMDNVKLVNCELIDSDLCFEYCSRIDAKINNVVDSIKNPISGKIVCRGIKELILESDKIDPSKTKIITNE